MKRLLRAFRFCTPGLVLGILAFAEQVHAQGAPVAAAAPAATSGLLNGSAGVGGWLLGTVLEPLTYAMLMLSSFILWVAGLVFNWVIVRTVFQFGTYFGTSDGMLTAWGVMRDVSNIGLLFSFIFMGVLLILNVEEGGHGHGGGISAKKALPRLIIFAVLLNFSLFATQAVIDVSNSLSAVFAEQAGQKCDTAAAEDDCINIGISALVNQRAGIGSIWGAQKLEINNPLKKSIVYIGLSIFVMVTAMVLWAAAIMFVYRAVVLSFLMITSPIGFAGLAIPTLNKIAKDWWSKLISQSFWAPAYLLLIFISLKVTETLAATPGSGGLAEAISGSGGGITRSASGNFQIVIVFMIVIGFMMASLVVATKMGASGAKFATQTAGALTLGTAGFVGRRTLGRASTRIASTIRRSPLGETNLGRKLAGVADYGSKASYSLRNVGTKAMGAAGTGVNLGTANKTAGHGYHGIEEKAEKDRVDYAKSLRGSRQESFNERDARVAREQTDLGQRRVAAAEAVRTTTAGAVAAGTAATTARTNFNTQQQQVAALRSQAAQNPQDAAVQGRLMQAEQILARREAELSQADQALTQARAAAAQALETQTAARDERVDERTRRAVSENTRQNNYADNIAHEETLQMMPRIMGIPILNERHGVTLAGHANHNAVGAIRRYAGMSDNDRLLVAMRDSLSRVGQQAPAAPAAAGGAPPAAH